MSTRRYYTNLAGVTPSPLVVMPTPAPRKGRGYVLGTPAAINNPLPNGPGQTGGLTTAGDGNPLGNPNYPCAAGPEILPSEVISLPLDVGTGYVFQHYLNASGLGQSLCRATAEFSPLRDLQQHYVSFDLYRNREALESIDEPTVVVLPLRSASITNPGTGNILRNAATALEALSTPQDNKYIESDSSVASTSITLAFDPTELSTNWTNGRIVSVGLRYIAWKDDDSEPTPGEGFLLTYVDTGIASSVGAGIYLINDYQRDATFQTKYLGEVNLAPRGKTMWPAHDLHPYTVEDLVSMSAAENRVFLRIEPQPGDLTQTTTYYDYFELVVEVIPEYRYCCAVRYVSNIWGDANNDESYSNDVVWRYPLSSSFTIPLPTDITGDMFLVVRESARQSESDYYRARTSGRLLVAGSESYGPSLEILGVQQTRSADESIELGELGQIWTYKVAVTDQQTVPTTFKDITDTRLSVAHYNPALVSTAGAFWASYRGMAGLEFQRVYTGQPRTQRVWLDGGTTYAYLRALVQPTSQSNGSIQWQVYDNALLMVSSTASYTVDQIRADTDEGNGWREVLLPLSIPITPFADGWYYLNVVSDSGVLQPWLIAAAEPTGLQPYFSYDVSPDGIGSGTARIIDYAMILTCEPPAIPAPDVTLVPLALDHESCGLTDVTVVNVEWVADGSWDQYVVVTRTAPDTTFVIKSLALRSEAAGETMTFVDTAPAWDHTTEYAIIGFRHFDLHNVISAYAPGVLIPSQGAVLGISTLGRDPYVVSLYVPVTESGSVEISWENLTPMETVPLHNRDYQRPLVSVEDRGLSFSVTVLVEHLAVCNGVVPETLSRGQRSLNPTVWDTLVELANWGRLWVQFPDGIVRSYSMRLGSMRTITENGLFSAELIFTPFSGSELGLVVD